ncbi:MAG TPA: polysaccharide biosynthesis tyrosine autokinase [Gemmatimonadaceae bacterium]|nr:polysaccharide biosynthesis tyrosine autokinase [Gemmatimonadaceae bacterium]
MAVENLPVLQTPLADPNPEIDLRRYWQTIARSAWIIVVCVGLAVAAAIAAVRKIQPVYQATATVRIDEQKQASSPAALYYFGGADYQTLLAQASEVITSRTLASKVVDDLGLRIGVEQPQRNAIIRSLYISAARTTPDAPTESYRFVKVPTGHEVRLASNDSLLGTYPDTGAFPIIGGWVALTGTARALDRLGIGLTRRIDAAEGLRGSIEVGQQNKDANVLSITFRGPDSILVRDIPNAVARAFVQRRMELDRSGATARVDYLNRQKAALTADIAEAEDSIQTYLQRQGIASVSQLEAALTNQLGELNTSLRDLDDQRVGLRQALAQPVASADSIEAAQQLLKQLQATSAFVRSGIATAEVGRLENLFASRRDLLTTLLPGSERVEAVDAQIGATTATIRSRTLQYVTNLDSEYVRKQREAATVTARLQHVPEQALELGKLERNRRIIEEMITLVQSQLKEAEITAAVSDSTASVLDDAVTPSQQTGSSETLIYAVAILSGLIVGVFVAFLRDWLDTTIRTEHDLAAIVGATVVGIIPNLQQQSRSMGYRLPSTAGADQKPAAGREYQTPAAEAYRTLRTNLNYLTPPRAPHVIVITSALPGDGKTTTTVNLAVTLAHQGQRVILIDAETRRGTVHEVFGIPPAPGFFDLMYGQASPGECIRRVQMEGGGTIDVLPLGSAPSVNPADLLVAARLQPLFERLRGQYDYVFLDTPPLNLFTDAALIGAQADALLLVARADKTDRDELRYSVQQLRNVNVTLAGAILNDVEFRRSSRYRLGYGYYYDYAR